MHEFSVCQGLLIQVEQVVAQHGARGATAIRLQIGPLSGVEPHLLEQAFPLASAGSCAEGAELSWESLPLRVHCRSCGAESEAVLLLSSLAMLNLLGKDTNLPVRRGRVALIERPKRRLAHTNEVPPTA